MSRQAGICGPPPARTGDPATCSWRVRIAPEPSLYKIFEIEYKGIKGTVRQASAKRTLRKIPKSSLVQVTDERSIGECMANRKGNSIREE
jgi:hypothetical protein